MLSSTTWKDIRSALKESLEKSSKEYESEIRLPYAKSKLGIDFKPTDLITFHFNPIKFKQVKTLAKVIHDHEADINDQQVINHCASFLLSYGSTWGGPEHSLNNFSNYFLNCLRYENVHAFRVIIGKAHGITFIEGACTLFRRDTRDYKMIFDQGFKLKDSSNTPTTRKTNYYGGITQSYGISTSFVIPPKCYGRSDQPAYFVIEYKAGHNALLIDIDNSPCNKGKHQSLQEVNSVDAIPPANIAKFVIQKPKSCFDCILYFFGVRHRNTQAFKNNNFKPSFSETHNLRKISKT
ncbi:MAG: hypothetical protein JO131_06445 [Gammaproteobacteria bacterium]|nr:hypothetical protein [Gammaproteobacteria bacterium]